MGNCQRKGWLHQVRCPRRPRSVYLGGKVCVISAMGIPGVVGDSCLPGILLSPCVCPWSLPRKLTIHLIWGPSKQHRGCVHSQVGPIPSQRRRQKQALENTWELWGGRREGKREPEAFPVKRPQTWTNTGGGDLGQEARLTKEPTAFRSQVGA